MTSHVIAEPACGAHRGAMTNTPTTDPRTLDALAAGYLAAWNADDPTARRAAIEATWTPDHRFCDPLAEAGGYDELDGFIAQVRSHYPGAAFRMVSGIDAHHDVARWSWAMTLPDGTVPAVGHDTVRLAADGRIAEFVGFFGPMPDPA